MQNVSDDFILIRRITTDSREFQLFLKSPVIKKEKKQEVLEVVFAKAIQPLTLQFLRLLTEKEREEMLLQIVDEFFQQQDARSGIAGVGVRAAIELSEEQTAQLKERFEVYTKKKVRLNFNIDKQLIGGLIVRIGDTVFDGSVKRQLELLEQRFVEEVSM